MRARLPGVLFRPRKLGDAADLFELFNEKRFLLQASARDPFASLEELQTWFDRIAAANRFEAVAVFQSKVVGFVGLYVHGDNLSHSGWLMLGVREAMQGRGIGSALLQIMIATANVVAKLQRVQLTVFKDNTGAIKLYRKFGFEFEGLHRRFVRRGEEYVDAYTMARLFDREDHGAAKIEPKELTDRARSS
jgi:putative acetyltransferase